MNEKPKYGWYSQQAITAGFSSWYYLTDSGQKVEVTSVLQDNDPVTVGYLWQDKICLGPVTKWLHDGVRGSRDANK